MAAIDIILILIFILTAWLGFRKGLIVQLGSVAAIVVAIIACRMFGATVENLFFDCHPDWQTGSSLSRYGVSILANGIIYLVAYYAVILVAKFLHTATHAILLAPLDHIAGALFSVAKYGLLVSLLPDSYTHIRAHETSKDGG
ncbi:MAG: CvpA family protein, partial [Duncaniella sp.]|nr:CvpA family protein [Duncaniella sp.]